MDRDLVARLAIGAAGVRVTAARPVLRGRLEPAENGSRFVGTLGWAPFVKVFSALWLGAVTCSFLVLFVVAIAMSLVGNATADVFLACLLPLGFMLSSSH
jgi:hypothetical protein